MKRRTFLQGTAGGFGAWAWWRRGLANAQPSAGLTVPPPRPDFASDGFQVPEWLHYTQAVYFDGYSPPVYPHMKDFDAQRLVDVATELGGNLLRFQPIGYRAYYPSQAFPLHDELGSRDLIDEVSRVCRRAGMHLYCYANYGMALMLEPEFLRTHPRFNDWLLRDPDGKPYGLYGHIGWMNTPRMICMTGDIYRSAIRQVAREYCAHDMDGVILTAPVNSLTRESVFATIAAGISRSPPAWIWSACGISELAPAWSPILNRSPLTPIWKRCRRGTRGRISKCRKTCWTCARSSTAAGNS